MNELQWTRLSEIQKRFEALGLTPEWIDRYIENRPLYPIDPEKAMTPDGRMVMLPPGTLPDYVFYETLQSIIKNMEVARQNAIQAHTLIHNQPLQLSTPNNAQGAVEANTCCSSSANLDAYQRHMCSFYVNQNDLHIHVNKYKPILAKEFIEEVNSLIDERLQILAFHYTCAGISFATKQLSRGSSYTKNYFH
jgi:hypothetical protein